MEALGTTVNVSGDHPESNIINTQINTDKPFLQLYVTMGAAHSSMLFQKQGDQIVLISQA